MKIENKAQLLAALQYVPETGLFTIVETGLPVGYVAPNGYVVVRYAGNNYSAHRLAWLYMTGAWPKQVDHKNHIKSDNRWENLREATASQNAFNRKGWGKYGLKGVRKVHNKWLAQATEKGRPVSLGTYSTKEEAHAAYVTFASVRAGEFLCVEMRDAQPLPS